MVDLCPLCGGPLTGRRIFRSHIRHSIMEFVRLHPGCRREEILLGVWGTHPPAEPKAVNVHISHMRPKLHELNMDILVSRGRMGGQYRLVSRGSPDESL